MHQNKQAYGERYVAGRIPDTAAFSGVIRTTTGSSGVIRTLPVFSGEIRTLKGVKTAK